MKNKGVSALLSVALFAAALSLALDVSEVSGNSVRTAKSPSEDDGRALRVSYTIPEGSGKSESHAVSNWTNANGNGLGEKIYSAARYVDRNNLSIDRLNVRLIMSECEDRKYGAKYRVPSGSFRVEAIEKISGFDTEKAFLESDYWNDRLLGVIKSNYNRCQGSYT